MSRLMMEFIARGSSVRCARVLEGSRWIDARRDGVSTVRLSLFLRWLLSSSPLSHSVFLSFSVRTDARNGAVEKREGGKGGAIATMAEAMPAGGAREFAARTVHSRRAKTRQRRAAVRSRRFRVDLSGKRPGYSRHFDGANERPARTSSTIAHTTLRVQ